MTWAYLLARWTEFARASVSFPDDGMGKRWKAVVPNIIGLQALTHALAEAKHLSADEHALALERAELGIRTHAGKIHEVWRGEPMPDSLIELIDDTRLAHEIARSLGIEYRVSADRLVVPDLMPMVEAIRGSGWRGTVRIAPAGTVLFAGEPVVFVSPCVGVPDAVHETMGAVQGVARVEEPVVPTQVYRQMDERTGRVTGDLIAPLRTELPPGRPLLLAVLDGGQPTGQLDGHDADRWLSQQRAAGLDEHDTLPVRTSPGGD